MSTKNNVVIIALAFFSIYVIWGSTYLFNKIAVSELAPFMLASVGWRGTPRKRPVFVQENGHM